MLKNSTVEIICNRTGLESISSEWNRLAEPLGTPLMCYEWFASCIDSLYKDSALRVITVRSNSKIVAIAPLVSVTKRGIRWLELIGSSFLHEPTGLLYDCKDSLSKLLKEIIKLRLPLLLQKIPSETSISGALRKHLKYRGLIIERTTSGTARVSINSSWDEFYSSISSRRRYDLRLVRRRAEQSGKVSFKIFCPELDEIDNCLDLAFKVEAAGWKGRKGTALKFNKKLQKFFRSYTKAACREKILRLCFMSISNEIAAMQIAVEYADRLWVFKIGYDEKWAKCSPGIQLTNEAIKYSFSKGLRSYEFLGSDEPWLHIWARDIASYTSIGMYPVSLYGLFGLSIDLADYAQRKVAGRFTKESGLRIPA